MLNNLKKCHDCEVDPGFTHIPGCDTEYCSHCGGQVLICGGADSSMVTYLCASGIRLGVYELGEELFIKKYCPHLKDYPNVGLLIKKLITTAYQATAQSGEVTRNAAEKLTKQLGIPHYEFDVEPLMKEYSKLGEVIQGSPLNFKDNDIVLQNLQARVRAPGIWIIANMQGKLLLTTSNMSEAAVGYATMDGDTAGCVAPIGGLPKVYIKKFLDWAEKLGPAPLGVCPALKYVNEQQPTAELRPKECNQTDEDDLMPYWLLHMIETMVVKNRYTPVEIYHAIKVNTSFVKSGEDNNQLIKDITKFFKLFSMNQWKRERYALSFHMDDHNLDPRTWCRTPILTGGYAEELKELEKYIK
jgi:NAD+ synthase (glutamine-hydrolysing)